MSDLNTEARALVEAARRSGRSAPPAARGRVRRAVLGAVALSSTAAATAGSVTLGKVILVAVASGALGSGITVAVTHSSDRAARHGQSTARQPPQVEPTAPLPEAPVSPAGEGARPHTPTASGADPEPLLPAPPLVEAEATRAPASGVRSVLTVDAPAPAPASRDVARLTPRPAATEAEPETPEIPVAVAVASGDQALGVEADLLLASLSAVSERRWIDASSMLDQYERRHRDGALVTEAAVVRVMVLCGEGKAEEARALAQQLAKRAPMNPAVQRVQQSCGASGR